MIRRKRERDDDLGRDNAVALLQALERIAAKTELFARRQGVVITPHLLPRPHLGVAARI